MKIAEHEIGFPFHEHFLRIALCPLFSAVKFLTSKHGNLENQRKEKNWSNPLGGNAHGCGRIKTERQTDSERKREREKERKREREKERQRTSERRRTGRILGNAHGCGERERKRE